MSSRAPERCLALLVRHALLVHLALEEVRYPSSRSLTELRRDLPADDVVPGFDRQLRDSRAHGAEPDDTDRLDLGGSHERRS